MIKQETPKEEKVFPADLHSQQLISLSAVDSQTKATPTAHDSFFF